MDFLVQWLLSTAVGLMQNYPGFATFLMVVGILRVSIKPFMALLQTIVDTTETEVDNKFLVAVMDSVFYKGFVFILDWLASVKAPKLK